MNPLVTVVTPAFNSEQFVGATMESVASQSLGDLEHLVVDDGSTDSTADLVRSRGAIDSRCMLLPNTEGKGPAGARNTAIRAARGRYIAFVDADDIWYPDKLSKQIQLLQESGAPLVFSAYDFIDESGRSTGRRKEVPDEVGYSQLVRANVIGCLTAMFDTERAGRPLMPQIHMRQDWGLWLRILRQSGGVARSIGEPLAALRLRPGSLSSNKLKATWYSFVLLSRIEKQGPWRAMRNIIGHNVWRLLSERRRSSGI